MKSMHIPLNARTNIFLSKVITPVVLLAGLLLLALVHFRGVLKITQTQDQQLHGMIVFSQGALAVNYLQNSGTNRPNVLYNGIQLVSYPDWSSRLTIDGQVMELWNNDHGYSVDSANRQIFSTTSANGWQVTQIVTLVNDHTITVGYDFVARKGGGSNLHHIVLDVMHARTGYWYAPSANGTTFTAQALPVNVPSLTNVQTGSSGGTPVHAIGTLALHLSGEYVASTNPVTLQDAQSFTVANGTQQSWASAFTTEYAIDNPQVDRIIPLGRETITFTPAQANTGQPINIPVPVGP